MTEARRMIVTITTRQFVSLLDKASQGDTRWPHLQQVRFLLDAAIEISDEQVQLLMPEARRELHTVR